MFSRPFTWPSWRRTRPTPPTSCHPQQHLDLIRDVAQHHDLPQFQEVAVLTASICTFVSKCDPHLRQFVHDCQGVVDAVLTSYANDSKPQHVSACQDLQQILAEILTFLRTYTKRAWYHKLLLNQKTKVKNIIMGFQERLRILAGIFELDNIAGIPPELLVERLPRAPASDPGSLPQVESGQTTAGGGNPDYPNPSTDIGLPANPNSVFGMQQSQIKGLTCTSVQGNNTTNYYHHSIFYFYGPVSGTGIPGSSIPQNLGIDGVVELGDGAGDEVDGMVQDNVSASEVVTQRSVIQRQHSCPPVTIGLTSAEDFLPLGTPSQSSHAGPSRRLSL